MIFFLLFSNLVMAAPLFLQWQGSGNVHVRIEDQHEEQICSLVKVDLSKEQDQVRYSSSFKCAPRYEYIVRGLTMRVDGNNLLDEQGKKIGFFSDSELHFMIYTPKVKINVNANIAEEGKLEIFQHFPYGRTDFKFKAQLDAE